MTFDGGWPTLCMTCGKPYTPDEMSVCSNAFHCCRDCVWFSGRVMTACEKHAELFQVRSPQSPRLIKGLIDSGGQTGICGWQYCHGSAICVLPYRHEGEHDTGLATSPARKNCPDCAETGDCEKHPNRLHHPSALMKGLDQWTPQQRMAREVILGMGGCAEIDRENNVICILEREHVEPCFQFLTPPRNEHGNRYHDLKCWTAPWQEMQAGRKTFEYRKHDRDFRVGDILVLEEYDQAKAALTGRTIQRRVTYLLQGGVFGVPEGFCVMSVEPWAQLAADDVVMLPIAPTDDKMISCIYCRKDKPCDYELTVRRPGETAQLGIHAECLMPFRVQNPRRNRGHE